jgi:ATP-dependent Lon protease
VTKEDEPSSGNSAGLPIAAAFLSVFLELPVPRNLTMSGAVVGDSHDHVSIHRVGDAIYKVKGAIHRNLDKIILPAENRPDVELGDVVPLKASSKIAAYAATLDDAVEIIWGRTAWDL